MLDLDTRSIVPHIRASSTPGRCDITIVARPLKMYVSITRGTGIEVFCATKRMASASDMLGFRPAFKMRWPFPLSGSRNIWGAGLIGKRFWPVAASGSCGGGGAKRASTAEATADSKSPLLEVRCIPSRGWWLCGYPVAAMFLRHTAVGSQQMDHELSVNALL